MIYDKKKIFPLYLTSITISFINGSAAQKSFVRQTWAVLEYHLMGQLKFNWVDQAGSVTIKFNETRSQSFIGLDSFGTWEEKSRPSMRFKAEHSFDSRIVLHEPFHMLGCKHQHVEQELMQSNRYGVNIENDELSILRYRQKGENRNYHPSPGDIDFLNRYDEFRSVGEEWRANQLVLREKAKAKRMASAQG